LKLNETIYNNSLDNPTYLFYGSPKLLEIIEQRQTQDSNNNIENEYAFKDKIKEISNGLEWNFEIGYNPDTDKVNIIMLMFWMI